MIRDHNSRIVGGLISYILLCCS